LVSSACELLMSSLADVRMFRKGVHGAPKPDANSGRGGGEHLKKALQLMALAAQQNNTDRMVEEDATYLIEYRGSSQIMRAFRALQEVARAGNFLLLRRHESWRSWDNFAVHYVFPNACIQGYLASVEMEETWMKPGCPLTSVEEAFQDPRWHPLLPFLAELLPQPMAMRFGRLPEGQAALLVQFLARGPQVSHLDLSGASLGLRREALRSLAAALAVDRKLLHLDMSNNSLGSEGVHMLCTALLEHPCLQELLLPKNHIGQVGAVKLVDLLRLNLNIQRIDLEDNPIGMEWHNYICLLQKDRSVTLASANEHDAAKRMSAANAPKVPSLPTMELGKGLQRLGSMSSRLRRKTGEDVVEAARSARTPRLLR